MYLSDTVGNDFGIAVEKTDQMFCEDEFKQSDGLGQGHAYDYPESCSLLCPLVFSGSEVLSYASRDCCYEGIDGYEGKPFDLHVCTDACNCDGGERVVVGLHEDICNRDDRVLDSAGKTVAYYLLQEWDIESDFPDIDLVDLICPDQADHA